MHTILLPKCAHGDFPCQVVATDTCKNIAYIVAKECSFSSPEEFAIAYAEHFLKTYDFIHKATARVSQVPWERAVVSGQFHRHAFVQGPGNERWNAFAVAQRGQVTSCTSEITGMVVLKTTQSGWERFHRNEYALLPDTNERMMASSVTAIWQCPVTVDYVATRAAVKTAMLEQFTGPPSKGTYSPGVQHTLHKMGLAVLETVKTIDRITINMPNIHYLPAKNLDAMAAPHKFEDDIFIPVDEPHGTIEATLVRSPQPKL